MDEFSISPESGREEPGGSFSGVELLLYVQDRNLDKHRRHCGFSLLHLLLFLRHSWQAPVFRRSIPADLKKSSTKGLSFGTCPYPGHRAPRSRHPLHVGVFLSHLTFKHSASIDRAAYLKGIPLRPMPYLSRTTGEASYE